MVPAVHASERSVLMFAQKAKDLIFPDDIAIRLKEKTMVRETESTTKQANINIPRMCLTSFQSLISMEDRMLSKAIMRILDDWTKHHPHAFGFPLITISGFTNQDTASLAKIQGFLAPVNYKSHDVRKYLQKRARNNFSCVIILGRKTKPRYEVEDHTGKEYTIDVCEFHSLNDLHLEKKPMTQYKVVALNGLILIKKVAEETRNISQPVCVNAVEMAGDRVYVTDTSGKPRGLDYRGVARVHFPQMRAKRIHLDAVNSEKDAEKKPITDTNESKDATLKATLIEKLMASLGLPLIKNSGLIDEKAKVSQRIRSLSLACENFPMRLVENTLQKWRTTPRVLTTLIINRETQSPSTCELMSHLSESIPLIHVWNVDTHDRSVFRWKNLSQKKEKLRQSQKDIYILFSDDDTRMAAIVASEETLSIRFGQALRGTFKYPVMKSAFAEATNSNNFYEVDAELLRERKRNAYFNQSDSLLWKWLIDN